MPNPTIEKIKLPGSNNVYDIVDAGARDLISSLSGGTKYLGVTTTPLTDGDTTNPITVGGNSVTATTGNIVIYGDAEFIWDGSKWDEFGDLSTLGHLAKLDSVIIGKGFGDMVLGESTTFTNAASAVTFSGGSSDTFVKSYPGASSKLATTTIPNVTNVGSADTWSFTINGTTLEISGSNGTVPTLGTAITAATGSLDANGGGASVMTGLGTATTASAVTGIGTGTAAAQAITVGTNDKFKVAKYDDIIGGTGVQIIGPGVAKRTITFDGMDDGDWVGLIIGNQNSLTLEGSEYYNPITTETDWIIDETECMVTMGGTNITSTALTIASDKKSCVIYIPDVTGNIVLKIRTTPDI